MFIISLTPHVQGFSIHGAISTLHVPKESSPNVSSSNISISKGGYGASFGILHYITYKSLNSGFNDFLIVFD